MTMRNTMYFAYGSNFWLDQMLRRCPGSKFVGVAVLRDWRWFICARGYANITRSPGDIVYGLVYSLTPRDEKLLDGYEGVPNTYIKQTQRFEMTAGPLAGTVVH